MLTPANNNIINQGTSENPRCANIKMNNVHLNIMSSWLRCKMSMQHSEINVISTFFTNRTDALGNQEKHVLLKFHQFSHAVFTGCIFKDIPNAIVATNNALVELNNCTFINCGNAVAANTASYVKMRNCTFRGCTQNVVRVNDESVVSAENTVFEHIPEFALVARLGSVLIIKECTASNIGKAFVVMNDGKLLMDNTQVHDCRSRAIVIHDVVFSIDNTEITRAAICGFVANDSFGAMRSSAIRDSANDSVHASNNSCVSLEQCTLSNCANCHVFASQNTFINMHECTITGGLWNPVLLSSFAVGNIVNCQFENTASPLVRVCERGFVTGNAASYGVVSDGSVRTISFKQQPDISKNLVDMLSYPPYVRGGNPDDIAATDVVPLQKVDMVYLPCGHSVQSGHEQAKMCNVCNTAVVNCRKVFAEEMCVVCNERHACVLCRPCCHMCMCWVCFLEERERNNKCCVCRALIQGYNIK